MQPAQRASNAAQRIMSCMSFLSNARGRSKRCGLMPVQTTSKTRAEGSRSAMSPVSSTLGAGVATQPVFAPLLERARFPARARVRRFRPSDAIGPCTLGSDPPLALLLDPYAYSGKTLRTARAVSPLTCATIGDGRRGAMAPFSSKQGHLEAIGSVYSG